MMSSFFNNMPIQKKTSKLMKLEQSGAFEDIINDYKNDVYIENDYKSITNSLKKRPSNTSMYSIKRHLANRPLMQPTYENDYTDF